MYVLQDTFVLTLQIQMFSNHVQQVIIAPKEAQIQLSAVQAPTNQTHTNRVV